MLTVYKASAGSGKTFTLAFEFIKHLLGQRVEDTGTFRLHKNGLGERHRSILAITFTNKATEEMKRRIVRELAVLAGAPLVSHRRSDYSQRLTETFRCTTDELREAASVALRGLLFDFNFFNVSTIDAFFQNVLRVFAREAELTGNYDVELDDRTAIETGISDMLASITAGRGRPRLEAWLERYMKSQFDSGLTFNLFNRAGALRRDLVRFVGDLTGEDYKMHAAEMTAYFDDPTRIERFEEALRGARDAAVEHTRTLIVQLTDIMDAHGMPPEGCINRYAWATLSSWLERKPKAPSDSVRALPEAEQKKRYYAAWAKKGIPDAVDSALIDALQAVAGAWDRITYMDLVGKQLFRLGMLADILRHVMAFRQDNNLILLSDTNDLLRRIIGGDDTPFIYERIGLWLRHFLIDEFQDTSRLQWQNLEPLVAQSLSEGNDSLIIGDEKQCIYRFRNSDPTLLQSQVQLCFPGRTAIEGNTPGANTNWRSSADVIGFNNTLFSMLAEDTGLTELYANVRQAVPESHAGYRGYVRMSRIEGDAEEFAAASLRLMAAEICRQLDSGYSQRDIAILVRKKKQAADVIDYLLDTAPQEYPRLAGLNVLSDEALLVSASPAVKVIVSVLRTMDKPVPETERGYNISEGEFAAVIRAYHQAVADGLDPSGAIGAAVEASRHKPESPTSASDSCAVSLTSLTENLIRDCLSESVRDRDAIYIAAFQDLVIDFCSRGPADIHSFLTWWDTRGSSEYLSTAPDIDAIRIMTVHKSKGLEFPCVHIPFANWRWIDLQGVKWFPAAGFDGIDPEIVPPMVAVEPNKALATGPLADEYNRLRRESMIDELNATYVAFTRAVDELIVNYDTRTLSDTTCWLGALLSAAADAMEPDNTHAVDADGVLTFGAPTTRDRKSAAAIAPDEPVPYDIMSYRVTDRHDVWSRIHVADPTENNEHRVRGIMLHDILAQIRTEADIPRAVRRGAAAGMLRGIATPDEAEEMLRQAVTDPRAARWFDPAASRIVTERTLTRPGEGNYRPDRIVWTAEGTVDVVDYKFGEEKPGPYGRQLRRYMNMLQEMGHSPVRGYIWYVDSGVIDEV